MNHTRVRNFLHSGGDLSPDISAHLSRCVQCREYAAMIGVLWTELPMLWPETPPDPLSINQAIARVQAIVRERQPRWRALRIGQDLGWVGIAILVGLAVAWVSGILEPEPVLPLSGNNSSSENNPPDDPSLPPPVPFTGFSDEITIFEADLDCNGTLERLTGNALSQPYFYGNLVLLDITMEAYVDGETRRVFEIQSEDPNAPDLLNPQLILLSEERCEQLLALPIAISGNLYGDLKVFRWDGVAMETVLEAPGWPILDPVQPGTITTLQTFGSDPHSGQCSQSQNTFVWDQSRFVQVSNSQRSELISCNNFRRTQPNGKIYQLTAALTDTLTGALTGNTYTEIFAQTDMNCDGRFERLLVQRPIQSSYEYVHPEIFRMALEIDRQTVWEIFPSEGGTLSEPELFSPGGCEKLLGVIEYQASDFGDLRVYQWNGESMQTIIETQGVPPSPRNLVSALTQQPDRPYTITTVQMGLFIDCKATDLVTTFEWDGETFRQTRQVASSRECEIQR